MTALKLQEELNLGSNRTALKMLDTLKKASHQSNKELLPKLKGNIKRAKTPIRTPRRLEHIALIFELNTSKIGFIKISPIENILELHDFIIEDNVKDQKWINENDKCVEKIVFKLRSWLSNFHKNYSNEHFAEYLNIFCKEFNKSIDEKRFNAGITFYELLQNLIKS